MERVIFFLPCRIPDDSASDVGGYPSIKKEGILAERRTYLFGTLLHLPYPFDSILLHSLDFFS